MGNRFEHLKKNKKNLDEFIEGATNTKEARVANKQIDKKDVLLSISGRIDREKESTKPLLLYLKKDIATDIEQYCHGNKQAILNYLVRRGLDSLIEEGQLTLVME